MILTYKYRIKDKSARKALRRHAYAVNQVWNYCVAYQRDTEARYRAGAPKHKWVSCFDLHKLTAGTSKELVLHAGSINEVCRIFCQARADHRRAPKFRASQGTKRALGWVPFRAADRQLSAENVITYLGKDYRFWLGHRPLPETMKGGAFVEDALGRWYVCLAVEASTELPCGAGEIGIDLGLKRLAACSDGSIIEAPRHFRRLEAKLATAQRAGNPRRAKAIHLKIKNCRKDFTHKATARLARDNRLIAVGNVSPSRLAKTRLAKSVRDAGWSMFRSQLAYKTASRRQAVYLDVDERFTSQTCSRCGVVPASSPKGMGALGIRRWECSDCGAVHDRDVNAAINILNVALSAQRRADESRGVA